MARAKKSSKKPSKKRKAGPKTSSRPKAKARPAANKKSRGERSASKALSLRTPPSLIEQMAQNALDRVDKLTSLLDVAKAMTKERDFNHLLALIMREARDCVEADRTSLFIVDRERNELWSKIAQGLEIREIRVPLGKGIAGFVADSGEHVRIKDAYFDDRFDKSWDQKTGYRTKAVMCVPMMDADKRVVGVLQAINKKRLLADGTEAFDGEFDVEDEELLSALAAQAAAAVENTLLNEEIDKLFEGFVKASVYAIESRDPTTSGHSERVALLSLGVAEALPRSQPFSHVHFSNEELRELRYASLLHDFGKVGVREHVLVKANKLSPAELEIVRARFHLARKTIECDCLRQQVDHLKMSPQDHAVLHGMQSSLTAQLGELDELWNFIEVCNRPSVLAEGSFERLHDVRRKTFLDPLGQSQSLLSEQEVEFLSVRRGSLTQAERVEIESHVVHTYKFLSTIPWTRDLRRVPAIAFAHHEKLDGHGYPRQLPADDIPLQSRIMTVADIYDALTASDRPYKRAVPHEKALDILMDEAKQGKVDAQLLSVFIDAKVPETTKVMPSEQRAAAAPDNHPRGAR